MEEIRLIDANALCDKVSRMGLQNGSVLGHHSGTADVIAEMIQDAPTIDPESLRPVARCTRLTFNGKPIGFQCSNCKGITAGSIGGFCTHCGANWGESYDELDL